MTTTDSNPLKLEIVQDREELIAWYKDNFRPLPWRLDRDPYRIWISEVMLQQTTVAAVLPYYERFLKRFPTVAALASSQLEDVYEVWAGLGYYSRARMLHRSALELHKNDFPKGYKELLEFPGFGPYTARAVSSFAFGEQVGVVDGNVIRLLSRRYFLNGEWWKPQQMRIYQTRADELADTKEAHLLNQALMELGATICTPKSPTCFLCPWKTRCVAFGSERIDQVPLARPRKAKKIWIWEPQVHTEKSKVLLVKNDYAPFLKGQWFLPGRVRSVQKAPAKYLYKHTVTTNEIYIQKIITERASTSKKLDGLWVKTNQVSRYTPVSLIRKALEVAKTRDHNEA
jgi:A/G-specific adenine glycosylase